jgi:hypothetical protein
MNLIRVKAVKSALAATFLLCVLTSCTGIKLAPEYDKAIVDGLVSVNQKMMQFFAATSSGTTSVTYEKRENTYNELIGSVDALAIQAEARPAPTNDITSLFWSGSATELNDNVKSSVFALNKISETVTKMRDTDKKQGVTATEVAAFKGQTVIYLDQALTYESFLKR